MANFREIEFRGKRFDDGNWEYGQLKSIHKGGAHYETAYYILDIYGEPRLARDAVDPNTIGQFVGLCSVFLLTGIFPPISLKQEMLRQEKERTQIEYQIDNLTETSDKIKLNEWILTYNDWINDVNTSKEMWGWASWYYSVDISGHTIINLV